MMAQEVLSWIGAARGALRGAVALSERQEQHLYDAQLRRLRGEILLDQDEDRAEEAEGLFHEALEIAHRPADRCRNVPIRVVSHPSLKPRSSPCANAPIRFHRT